MSDLPFAAVDEEPTPGLEPGAVASWWAQQGRPVDLQSALDRHWEAQTGKKPDRPEPTPSQKATREFLAPFLSDPHAQPLFTAAAFIGPGQVGRLGLAPGSRGSLQALERAQAAWDKGVVKDGKIANLPAQAEIWAKEGWAPPEAFGVRGNPFTWLEAPDLNVRQRIRDMHMKGVAKRSPVTTSGKLPAVFEDNADLRRLLQAEPKLAEVDVGLGTMAPFNGGARFTRSKVADETSPLNPPISVYGNARTLPLAESIMRGHELRGHTVGAYDGVPRLRLGDVMDANAGVNRNHAARGRLEKAASDLQDEIGSSQTESLRRMDAQHERAIVDRVLKDADKHSHYFSRPYEMMARHAQVLDATEIGGKTPFAPALSPGQPMVPWLDSAFPGGRPSFDQNNSLGFYRLRDLRPKDRARPQFTPEELAILGVE